MCGRGVSLRMVPVAVLSSICLAACAQITVITDNAPPKTEWKFGVLAIDLAGSQKNTIVATKGVGLITTPDGPTLGYANARIVRLGTECRLVLQANDPTDIASREELLRLLKSIPKACAA